MSLLLNLERLGLFWIVPMLYQLLERPITGPLARELGQRGFSLLSGKFSSPAPSVVELPLEPPPEFKTSMPVCLATYSNGVPEVVGHLTPVDLECLSSRQGESPYSLCPSQLLNRSFSSHLAIRKADAGDTCCAGACKNVGISRRHLDLNLILRPVAKHLSHTE